MYNIYKSKQDTLAIEDFNVDIDFGKRLVQIN